MKYKSLLHFVLLCFLLNTALAQNNAGSTNDIGRIALHTYLSDKVQIPTEARNQFETKLTQIASINGMGGNNYNPRFIITANVNVLTKDVVAGPPQMIAQNVEIVLFIGDAITNTVYATTSLNLKGVGTNENKAFIEAIKNIKPQSEAIKNFIESGKTKILEYYNTQCDFIIKEAQTLQGQDKFEEAIYKLTQVPEVCKSCYEKCLDAIKPIYLSMLDKDCKTKLNQAKLKWNASQSIKGAEDAAEILNTIDINSPCQTEVAKFSTSIKNKLNEDERRRWEFKMKQYNDKIAMAKEQQRQNEENDKRNFELTKEQQKQNVANDQRNFELNKEQQKQNFALSQQRIEAYRQVAVSYAQNQPKQITYNNIYWR